MNSEQPRLESWKEIGVYLQRDATTARRWEKEEGLPVHRHSHKSRSSVYAYPSEIDAWRATRKLVPEPPAARPLWKIPAFALTMLLCLIMVGNGVRPAAAQQGTGRTPTKRLCAECGDLGLPATITSDGRWLAGTDWDTEDVAVRDLVTGKQVRLTSRTDPNEGSEWSMLSPDLRQVVYLWNTNEREERAQLRVMPNEPGGKPRVLVDNLEFQYFTPIGWSPNQKSILLIAQKPDRTWQLVQVSSADGTITVLKSLNWRLFGAQERTQSLSPDGRYIVYEALAVNPPTQHAPRSSGMFTFTSLRRMAPAKLKL